LYPDDNHKPEMAIALTDFEALVGFADKEIIIANI
jgi:mannose-6-phosphate isomerase